MAVYCYSCKKVYDPSKETCDCPINVGDIEPIDANFFKKKIKNINKIIKKLKPISLENLDFNNTMFILALSIKIEEIELNFKKCLEDIKKLTND